jgi:putative sigma-54 modulation protein
MANAKLVNVNITFRNTDATDALKAYATEKIANCVGKFVHRDTEAHVVLKVERNRQIAEVSLRSDGADFAGREESDNLYASIDALADSISQQLRRHKDKLTNHH